MNVSREPTLQRRRALRRIGMLVLVLASGCRDHGGGAAGGGTAGGGGGTAGGGGSGSSAPAGDWDLLLWDQSTWT